MTTHTHGPQPTGSWLHADMFNLTRHHGFRFEELTEAGDGWVYAKGRTQLIIFKDGAFNLCTNVNRRNEMIYGGLGTAALQTKLTEVL